MQFETWKLEIWPEFALSKSHQLIPLKHWGEGWRVVYFQKFKGFFHRYAAAINLTVISIRGQCESDLSWELQVLRDQKVSRKSKSFLVTLLEKRTDVPCFPPLLKCSRRPHDAKYSGVFLKREARILNINASPQPYNPSPIISRYHIMSFNFVPNFCYAAVIRRGNLNDACIHADHDYSTKEK